MILAREEVDPKSTSPWSNCFVHVVHDANVYVAAHESERLVPLIVQFIGLDPATVTHMVHPTRSPWLVRGAGAGRP